MIRLVRAGNCNVIQFALVHPSLIRRYNYSVDTIHKPYHTQYHLLKIYLLNKQKAVLCLQEK